MKFSATKKFTGLPCAHQQWFDSDGSGEPYSGSCAKFHGYEREVEITITGQVDSHGWVFPFGSLKKVRSWLEFYFDHTAVIGADDPRLDATRKFNGEHQLFNLRVLPFGVSMEMSSLFSWMWINHYVYNVSQGRVVVSKVESRETDKNGASVEFHPGQAAAFAEGLNANKEIFELPRNSNWSFVPPEYVISQIETASASADLLQRVSMPLRSM